MSRQVYNDTWASGGDKVDPGSVKTTTGWIVEAPPHEHFNFWQGQTDEMLQHLERNGIAVYDAATIYELAAYTREGTITYRSLVSSNTGNLPSTSPVEWVQAFLIPSNNLSDVADIPTARTNLDVDSSSEVDTKISNATPAASETVSGIVELATDIETQAGTDTERAVTPANLQSKVSTVAQKGIVELATNAETQTGTDTERAVTPAGLQSKVASVTVKGIVELATNAETQTGTDTERAVTSAGLQSKVASETAIGLVERATNAEASTGSDTTRFINALQLKTEITAATPSASETVEGLVERATDAEASAGTDTTRYITPKQLIDNASTPPPASETVQGIAELATQAEVDAGTDDTRIITPLKLNNRSFESAEQTITSAGSLTIAHGLSVAPVKLFMHLVCKTAQLGYSINDVVPIGIGQQSTSLADQKGVSVTPDGTNLVVRFGSHANTFELTNKTTGAGAPITNTSWKIIFGAVL